MSVLSVCVMAVLSWMQLVDSWRRGLDYPSLRRMPPLTSLLGM